MTEATGATGADASGGIDPVRDRWRAAMRLALVEAGLAAEGGDVPVGAVVLAPDGTTVLAAGHNEREATGDPTAHAEVLAVRRAAAALSESAARGASGKGGGGRRAASGG